MIAKERVLITGGATGIGAAIAERCWLDGYEPVVIDIEGTGINADLADPIETAKALQTALSDGAITRLINNVGRVMPATAEMQTLEEFDAVFALNLRCAMQCMQALLPGMKAAQFGRIVNISSRAALGKKYRSAYSATKAGLIGLTKVWALELGVLNITANAVAPGPIATELFANANPADAPETIQIIESIPVRRVGRPEDVAHAASYFLDGESGFVTGQLLFVCGGSSIA